MSTVIGDKALNKVIAHLPEVQDEVKLQADKIATKARERLARHRDTGESRIEVTTDNQVGSRGRGIDRLVSLVDPAAVSIEYGHFTNWGDKHVPGLYIITGAAGLI